MAAENQDYEKYFNPQLDCLLAQTCQRKQYPARCAFLLPGTKIDYMIYVHSGRTRHSMLHEDGSIKALYSLDAGGIFGERPCLDKDETTLLSQTELPSELFLIPREMARQLLATSELFREALLQCTFQKLLSTRRHIADISFTPVRTRMLKLLSSLADQDQPDQDGWYPLKIRYTHHEIGEIIGGNRVTISRNIAELTEEGILRAQDGRMQIHLARALQQCPPV